MYNDRFCSEQQESCFYRVKKLIHSKFPAVYRFFFCGPPFYIRHFFPILVTLGLVGGAAALLIPSNTGWLRQSGLSGEAEQKSISDLRLHFLYITGGIIAILTLLQTNWKNQVDRQKVEADIKKNEVDAQKSERDHIRQVQSERRSRYAKAVEQLGDEKVAIRLGGVYTLVGLVDEWLADDTLTPENQRKEGQVIINSLCSYIRSPFSLAIDGNIMAYDGINYDMPPEDYEGDYRADQARLIDEQDTRISIFKEISSRIHNENLSINNQKYWNNFSYDFSRSVIFYPLRNLYFSGADFSFAIFIGDTSFESSQFLRRTSFTGGHFNDGIGFNNAYFNEGADFSDTTFEEGADFINSKFTGCVNFGGSFINDMDFSKSYFSHNCEHIWQFAMKKYKPETKYGIASLIMPNNEAVTKILPINSFLFDPDSWDEEKQKYTRVSEPAKPIEDSDAEEEKTN